MQNVLSEDELNAIYNWVDEIPLSKPKKYINYNINPRNIARDFADGVLVAEMINNYNP